MTKQLLLISMAVTSLMACQSLQDSRRTASPPPPAVAERERGPTPLPMETRRQIEAELEEELTGQISPPAETPAPIPAAVEAKPPADSSEMTLILRDKNGKVVSGGSSPTQNIPAPPMITPPAPSTVGTPAPPVLVSDEDFEQARTQIASPPVQRRTGKVAADTAFTWLKNGNRRFHRGLFRADGQSKKDIQRLVAAETPHAVVLACSDSRMPPEIVFDQKLGEIYVVRNAEARLDDSSLQSVDDAVLNLGVNLVVIVTNSECQPDGIDGMQRVANEILSRSPGIQSAVTAGQVRIEVGVYNLKDGRVEFKAR